MAIDRSGARPRQTADPNQKPRTPTPKAARTMRAGSDANGATTPIAASRPPDALAASAGVAALGIVPQRHVVPDEGDADARQIHLVDEPVGGGLAAPQSREAVDHRSRPRLINGQGSITRSPSTATSSSCMLTVPHAWSGMMRTRSPIAYPGSGTPSARTMTPCSSSANVTCTSGRPTISPERAPAVVLAGERLEPGVDDVPPGSGPAHDRGEDRQRAILGPRHPEMDLHPVVEDVVAGSDLA